MKAFSVIIALVVVALASSYRFQPAQRNFGQSCLKPLRMSDEKKTTDIVPLESKNIENAAAVTGGILGLVVGGPVIALIVAAVTNFVVKKDTDAGEAVRGVGKTVIESYNFLTKINSKYEITSKVGSSVSKAASSLDTGNEQLDTVKSTVSSTITKVDEINKEYDLVSKGKQALEVASGLSDTAIEKVIELNAKYDFVETAKSTLKGVLDKSKDALNKD